MTETLFIRHGESSTNLAHNLIGGRSNHAPLSPRGLQQARLIGRYLQSINLQPDVAYSSGAVRADTTGRIAFAEASITTPIEIDENLQELSQGVYEGRERRDVYTPEVIKTCRLNELDGKFPGGESVVDAQARMWDFLERACERTPDGLVVAFSHGLAIRALAGYILNQTKREILDTATDNVSLTSISVDDGQASVNYVGRNVITE